MISKNAILRKLSPLEKTAAIAGMNSTHDGSGLSPEEILEELVSKQEGRPIDIDKLLNRR